MIFLYELFTKQKEYQKKLEKFLVLPNFHTNICAMRQRKQMSVIDTHDRY